MTKIELTIIILNYNTKQLAIDCIESIEKNYLSDVISGRFQVIIADNASPDKSINDFEKYSQKTKIKNFIVLNNNVNLGFAKGNNKAVKFSKGRYILFLNPDTILYPKTLNRLIDFMNNNSEAGAATCRIEIPSGGIDEASHRGFPTPWNAFTHFSGLEKLFPRSRIFAGYLQGAKNLEEIHQVDVIAGAFLFVRREIGEKIGWWDEEYFFYGEDIQFCYNIRKLGYKIFYIPDVAILHYGGVSSGLKKHSQHITTADHHHKKKMQGHRFDAMRIFFRKNYSDKYPSLLRLIVNKGINILHKKHTT